MSTGTLLITRRHQYADLVRRYRIIVDGREVGRIKAGEPLRVELPDGEHPVVARLDWTRSNRLTVIIRAGETTDIEVGSNVTGCKLLAVWYFATLGAARYLYLRQRISAFPVSFLNTPRRHNE